MLITNRTMLKIIALALLVFPAMLAAQSVITIAPQQCVWHIGDDPGSAATDLDESGWQPYAASSTAVAEPRFWIRCHFNPAAFRGLDQPAVQIRMLAAYEAFLNGLSIARNGNLQTGNFGMNSIRVCPVSQPFRQDSDVLALRVALRYTTGAPAGIRLGDERALENDRAGYLLGIMPSALLQILPFITIGIFSLVLLGFSLSDRSHLEAILLGVTNVAAGLLFLEILVTRLMLNEPVWLSLGLLAIEGAISIITQFWFYFALARRRIPAVFWFPMGVWVFSAVWQLTELFVPLRLALQLDHIHAAELAPSNFGAAGCFLRAQTLAD